MTARRTHLVFDSQIGGTKPVTVVDVGHKCPFCNRDELTGVIAADGPLLLIANKYPVLQEHSSPSLSKPRTARASCRCIRKTTCIA